MRVPFLGVPRLGRVQRWVVNFYAVVVAELLAFRGLEFLRVLVCEVPDGFLDIDRGADVGVGRHGGLFFAVGG